MNWTENKRFQIFYITPSVNVTHVIIGRIPWERKFLGTFIPGNDSSIPRTFAAGNESS